MKILQSCLENFAFFGLNPPQLLNIHLINKRNSLVLFIFISNAILAGVFFSCKAEVIADYADSFSVTWSDTFSAINVSLLIYKIRDVFKFIERLESTINKSKRLYHHFNLVQIET